MPDSSEEVEIIFPDEQGLVVPGVQDRTAEIARYLDQDSLPAHQSRGGPVKRWVQETFGPMLGKEMSLQTAHGILRDVIAVPESTITPESDISLIGGHDPKKVEEAARVTAVALMDEHNAPAKPDLVPNSTIRELSKRLPGDKEGDKELRLVYDRNGLRLIYGIPFTVGSGAFESLDICNSLNLDPNATINTGFTEKVGSEYISQTYGKSYEIKKVGHFQKLLRGNRWMFANMLAWNYPGIILPSDLEQAALSAPNSASPRKLTGK